jgi:hypothetical protein
VDMGKVCVWLVKPDPTRGAPIQLSASFLTNFKHPIPDTTNWVKIFDFQHWPEARCRAVGSLAGDNRLDTYKHKMPGINAAVAVLNCSTLAYLRG